MLQITTRNVYSFLNDYTEELEKILTVPYPNYWFSPRYRQGLWDGKHHFLKIPSCKFPTGLLFIVENYCKKTSTKYEVVDRRIATTISKKESVVPNDLLDGITLRPYQVEAVQAALRSGRGIIEAPTGSGKTEIAIAIVKKIGARTLFMVNSKDLLYQTAERFEKRLPGTTVGRIGEGLLEIEPITIATVQSLLSILKRVPREGKDLLNFYEVMIQDECHHSSSMNFYKLAMFMHNAYWRFGFSGTALRRDVLSNMKAMAITGPAIYNIETSDLIKKGYLSDIQIKVLENSEIVHEATWQKIYEAGVVTSTTRNELIVQQVVKEFKKKKKVIVLVRYVEHGKILQKLLEDRSTPALFVWGTHDGGYRTEVKDKFNRKGKFVLITSDIFSEGVDIPAIDVLVIASGGKSEWKTIQKVGRGLRKKGKNDILLVYDIQDSSKYLKTHSKERLEIYKKEGWMEDEQ